MQTSPKSAWGEHEGGGYDPLVLNELICALARKNKEVSPCEAYRFQVCMGEREGEGMTPRIKCFLIFCRRQKMRTATPYEVAVHFASGQVITCTYKSRWVVSSLLYCFQHPTANGSREACKPHTDPTSPITGCEDKKDPNTFICWEHISCALWLFYHSISKNKRGKCDIFRKIIPRRRGSVP